VKVLFIAGALLACLTSLAPALAIRLPVISKIELAKAIKESGRGKFGVNELMSIRCEGWIPEKKEVQCRWRQWSPNGWNAQMSKFRIDGAGWHIIA
jgi:hypothetical protein